MRAVRVRLSKYRSIMRSSPTRGGFGLSESTAAFRRVMPHLPKGDDLGRQLLFAKDLEEIEGSQSMIAILIAFFSVHFTVGMACNLLPAAWPVLYGPFNAPVSGAGIWAAILTGMMGVSSLFAAKLVKRFGAGRVALVSMSVVAACVLTMGFAQSFALICIATLPMGIAAGIVFPLANSFIASHYRPVHMSLALGFNGIGCAAGPAVMSLFLAAESWRGGFFTNAAAVAAVAFAVLMLLPCFRRTSDIEPVETEKSERAVGNGETLRVPGVVAAMAVLFCSQSIIGVFGLWSSTYMVETRGIAAEIAARYASMYFLGDVVGCIVSALLLIRISPKAIIRIGIVTLLPAVLLMVLPLPDIFSAIAMALAGLGGATVMPNIICMCAPRFTKRYAETSVGLVTAASYFGNMVSPLVYGVIGEKLGFFTLAPFVLLLVIGIAVFTEINNRRFANR